MQTHTTHTHTLSGQTVILCLAETQKRRNNWLAGQGEVTVMKGGGEEKNKRLTV